MSIQINIFAGKHSIYSTLGVVDKISYAGRVIFWDSQNNRINAVYLADPVSQSSLIYPGTAAYTDALMQAAEIEDRIAASGESKAPYSDTVPEVKNYRKNIGLAEYSITQWWLPAPYFPHVIQESSARTPVTRAIFESQKAIVKSTDYGNFKVSADVPVQPSTRDFNLLVALKDYAIANGLRLISSDQQNYSSFLMRDLLNQEINLDDFKSVLFGDDEDFIRKNADTFIKIKMQKWFDFEGDSAFSINLPYEITAAVNSVIIELKKAQEKPDDVVGISGSATFKYKETLKEYANDHSFPNYGKSYEWDKLDKVWLISRAAWDAFIKDHPEAKSSMKATTSTKKL